jgi:hypothetical protein
MGVEFLADLTAGEQRFERTQAHGGLGANGQTFEADRLSHPGRIPDE